MRKLFEAVTFLVVATSLTGCSAGLSKEQAIDALRQAHSDCQVGLPSVALAEPIFLDDAGTQVLKYTLDRNQPLTLVQCVSVALLGEDLTQREFNGAEITAIQEAYQWDASGSSLFHTGLLYGWHKPFDFVREATYSSTEFSFVWWPNGQRSSIEDKR